MSTLHQAFTRTKAIRRTCPAGSSFGNRLLNNWLSLQTQMERSTTPAQQIYTWQSTLDKESPTESPTF